MLVKTKITESREIDKNIQLPYYSKKDQTFYRINEDESVMRIVVEENFHQMALSRPSKWYPSLFLDAAVQADECNPEEVETAAKSYFEQMGDTINTLAESV